MSGLGVYFSALEDPRASNVRHRLGDVCVMMIAASLCGATSATEMALFAAQRRPALLRLIAYEQAPSHDTFSRMLRLIAPDRFSALLARLAGALGAQVATAGGPDVVAIDGKALRHAYEKGCAAHPALTVSAFAARTRLCLGAAAPGPQANEIEAALAVVDLLDLAGRIVTADALHCHHRMADAVTRRGGDYLLALKGNRRQWLAMARGAFADGREPDLVQEEIGHDRHERRCVFVRPTDKPLAAGHAAFVRIDASRDGGPARTRLFLASRCFTPEEALAITRAHWSIENALHWMLDVHLCEDARRVRRDNAPENTAILGRIARNILQACDTPKNPIAHRIRKCAWNDDYLIKAIAHMR